MLKSNGQSSVNLQKTIAIRANTIQLDSLLYLIKKQTGIKFSINARKFPPAKFIRIINHRPTIAGVLTEINKNTGVYYVVLENHIVLLDNPPPVKKKKINPVKKSPPVPASKKKPPVIDHPANVTPLLPVYTASPKTIDSNTVKAIPIIPVTTDSIKAAQPIPKRPEPAKSQSTRYAVAESERQPMLNKLYVKGGISADDFFYCNPTIQVGIANFYGIASWSCNFNISEFRYGVGAFVALDDQWKLHLQVTTGNLSSKFDSISQHWELKTRLHRAGCLAEVNVANRISIQFGPVFNLMKLTFYHAGEKTAPRVLTGNTGTIDKKFNLLQPVYTISDNYSINKSQSTKCWLGLQVSIFYDLNFFKRE